MFYCKKCADVRGWPAQPWQSRSKGPCELCGKTAICFDAPTRMLSRIAKPTPKSKEGNR